VLYTGLVRKNILSLETLIDKMTRVPRSRFGIPQPENDTCEWDLETEYEIRPSEFLSLGKATPFEGWKVYGRCLRTVCNGKESWHA
jgi:dihydroorotase